VEPVTTPLFYFASWKRWRGEDMRMTPSASIAWTCQA
jgi:hypothetical protein